MQLPLIKKAINCLVSELSEMMMTSSHPEVAEEEEAAEVAEVKVEEEVVAEDNKIQKHC